MTYLKGICILKETLIDVVIPKEGIFNGNLAESMGFNGYLWDLMVTLQNLGFPGGSAGKESAWNMGNLGLSPWLGRSPREGKGYPLQYSGLENSMDSKSMGLQRVGHNWATFTLLAESVGSWSISKRQSISNQLPISPQYHSLLSPVVECGCTSCCLFNRIHQYWGISVITNISLGLGVMKTDKTHIH